MSMALNHPLYGYYHNKIDANNSNDKIGERGDFITAPVLAYYAKPNQHVDSYVSLNTFSTGFRKSASFLVNAS